MIRTASPDDLPALRALFARANDAPYDLGAVAEEKCFGLGVAGQPCVRVSGDMQGAIVTCGKYVRILVVDRDIRRRGIATELLADAETRGASVIAAEPGNYFTPGVVDSDVAANAFFHRRGYIETRFTHNLEVGTTPHPPSAPSPLTRGEGAQSSSLSPRQLHRRGERVAEGRVRGDLAISVIRMPHTVVIALGSNLGDRAYNLRRAIHHLPIRVVRISAFLETEPVDAPPPMFLNAVVTGYTSLEPQVLMQELLALEKRLGRARRGVRNEPRIIDLDLIAYGATRMRTPSLTLPHPRAHEREFVMKPLRTISDVECCRGA